MSEPWVRRVEIGPHVLASRPLCPHVTGLAKADQVRASVGILNAKEMPKWLDMVDRKGLADVRPAVGAASALFMNDNFPCFQPAPPSIGGRTADVARRAFGNEALRRPETYWTAKFRVSILPGKPRFLTKFCATMSACPLQSFLPSRIVRTGGSVRREGVSGLQAKSQLVAPHVRLRPRVQAGFRVPHAAASLRAKSRRRSAVRLYCESALADFACFFDCHTPRINKEQRRSMGNGTTNIACDRIRKEMAQPRLDLPAPPKPTQEALL